MCRLFGLISNKTADFALEFFGVHRSIQIQSKYNPHGWGVGWYEGETPRIYKEPLPLHKSPMAYKIASKHIIQAKLVISHIRLATEGSISLENTHPFSYDKYVFAHNGHIDKKPLSYILDKEERNKVKGETDSEIYFHWLLQHIEEANDTLAGLRRGVKEIIEDKVRYRSLNFLFSDGKKLYAFRGYNTHPENYTLYYIIRKPQDYDFDHLSRETGSIIKLELERRENVGIIASEKLTTDEEWEPIENNTLIEIDSGLFVKIHHL